MQAVNIRQLKNNPSQALKAAHDDDMVVVMNRDTPAAVLVDLEKLGLPDVAAVREILAITLFKEGAISAGAAARMAGKALPEMLKRLSSMGIPLTTSNRDEAANDMATAREWLQQHP
jgi:prevent-host-death family protein